MNIKALSELFEEEGLYRMVAVICATITVGEAKDKSKGAVKRQAQDVIAVAADYHEFMDPLGADLPDMPMLKGPAK